MVAARAREMYDKATKERQKRKPKDSVPKNLLEQRTDAHDAAGKAPKSPAFSMPDETNVARMFRSDLAAARKAWLEASQEAEERMRRKQSDFLQAESRDGEKADFHSLRHTCGGWLAMNGEHFRERRTSEGVPHKVLGRQAARRGEVWRK